MISLTSYLLLAAFLFACGLACIVVRRNVIHILMGVELLLNAGAINFAAFAHFAPMKNPELALSGQVMSIFIIVLAAAEAGVALAIVLSVFRLFKTVDARVLTDLKG